MPAVTELSGWAYAGELAVPLTPFTYTVLTSYYKHLDSTVSLPHSHWKEAVVLKSLPLMPPERIK